MYFYYFMLRRYQRGWQQVKCFALYLSVFIAIFLLGGLLKTYWIFGYHLVLLFLGWLTATFLEYVAHRFWMHTGKAKSKTSALAQLHHHHHTHPTEIKITAGMRLALLLLLAVFLYAAGRLQNLLTLPVGVYLGFCSYVLMHKAIHQPWAARIFPKLFRYHVYHHCRFPNKCFGITVTWWDAVFHTQPPKKVMLSERIQTFYLEGTNAITADQPA